MRGQNCIITVEISTPYDQYFPIFSYFANLFHEVESTLRPILYSSRPIKLHIFCTLAIICIISCRKLRKKEWKECI